MSGFEVVYADGTSDRVLWKYVCARGTGIGFSPVVRELHPRLPQVVSFMCPRPERVIARLRERAVAREMRCGTYRDYFLAPKPPLSMSLMLIGSLIAFPFLAARYVALVPPTFFSESTQNELPFEQWAAMSGVELLVAGFWVLVWAGYVLSILHYRRVLFGSGVLAFETDDSFLILHKKDGQLQRLPWSDLKSVGSDGRMYFSDNRNFRLPHDARARWMPLVRALRRRSAAVRSPREKIPWTVFALTLLAALPIAALAALLPGSESTPLAMIAKVLAAGGVFAVCMAILSWTSRHRAAVEFGR